MSAGKLAQDTHFLDSLTEVQRIQSLAAKATENKYSFAFYRMPNQQHIQFISGKKLHAIDHEDLSSLRPGFLLSSFEGEHFYFEKDFTYTAGVLAENITELTGNFDKAVLPKWQPYIIPNEAASTESTAYIKNVSDSIKEIRGSELIKIVPSRTKRVTFDFRNIPEVFIQLCKLYPTAFVSITSAPELGTWVGATPESLIEVDSKGIFKTMSLAGTQKYNGEPLHTLPWTQKEIEEQAMVSRYIINRFKEIRLREFIEVGPRTVSAGNMAHLCSIFTVDTIATDFPDLGSVMLGLLHPTSAVCGMPKQQAKDFLDKVEKHDRRLFSGYLGPVNMPEGSYIYVNLRCMEVQEEQAILYAGAGVTEYSVPEDEWQETELKCNTLLNVIRNQR